MPTYKSSHYPFHTNEKSVLTIGKYANQKTSTSDHSKVPLWSGALAVQVHFFTLVTNRMQKHVSTKVRYSYQLAEQDVYDS